MSDNNTPTNPVGELLQALLQQNRKETTGVGAVVVGIVLALQILPLLRPNDDAAALRAELERTRAVVREVERYCAPSRAPAPLPAPTGPP